MKACRERPWYTYTYYGKLTDCYTILIRKKSALSNTKNETLITSAAIANKGIYVVIKSAFLKQLFFFITASRKAVRIQPFILG